MENWKSANNFEGLYEVSNLGNIRSIFKKSSKNGRKSTKKIRVLKTYNQKGYRSIKLRKNGKIVSVIVHRLIAQTFIPNPENKPFVNHINEIKSDNRVENLEWCTNEENLYHSRNITKSSKVISRQKILRLYEENKSKDLEYFLDILISNCT